MATLFLLSTITSSINSYANKPSNTCQTLTDLFNMARYYWHKRKFIESYRLFCELEESHQYKAPICAWYQILCLVHLGHWRHAIKKCNEWKQKQPRVAQWYLLASDIYAEQLDFTMAHEELFQALIHVPESDDAYAEICLKKRITFEGAQHVKLSQNTLNDILDILPYDVACDVFLCLDLESLVRCCRVSKKWRHFLISSPCLWSELEFTKRSAHLNKSTMDTYLSRLKKTRLTKLSIRNQQTDGDGILMTLVRHECYNLKVLVLSDIICTPALFFNVLTYIGSTLHTLQWGGVSVRLNDLIDALPAVCKNLKNLVVHDCFTSLQDIQPHHESLRRIEFYGESFPTEFINSIKTNPQLHHVESLTLVGIHGLTATHLASVLIRFPNLKRLQLKRCLVNIIPVLNILKFCCPKLQYFDYERNRYNQHSDSYSESSSQQQQQQQLQREQQRRSHRKSQNGQCISKEYPWIQFKIQLTNMLTDSILHSLLRDSKSRASIESLDLQGSFLLSDSGLLVDKQPMENLKYLCLKDCFGLTTKGIEDILLQSPLLEEVDLSSLSMINDNILYALSRCKQLQYLNLSHCRLNLISEEAYKFFIEQRSCTLKRVILDHVTHASFEIQLYTTKKIKRGII